MDDSCDVADAVCLSLSCGDATPSLFVRLLPDEPLGHEECGCAPKDHAV